MSVIQLDFLDLFPEELPAPVSGPLSAPLEGPKPFVVTPELFAPRTDHSMIEDNLAAIRILNNTRSVSALTPEQQATLAKYSGWGAFPQVFYDADGEVRSDFADAARTLRQLLSEGEYEMARRSTPSAFYTDYAVSRLLWKGLEHFGFAGGRVLEPSCGVAHTLGTMPAELRAKSDLLAVEIDRTSSRIVSRLYPEVRLLGETGFEDADLPNNSVDLVIGNPPFGEFRLYDGAHKDLSRLSVHNYFITKSLRLLRPGGLLAFVVSRHFMDARKRDARKKVAEMADLLAAFRLPGDAMKDQWRMENTVDLVFFRKRFDDEPMSSQTADFIETGMLERWFQGDFRRVPVSSYFLNHSAHAIGRLEITTGPHGMTSHCLGHPSASPSSDVPALLNELPGNVFNPRGELPALAAFETVTPPEGLRAGHLFLHNGACYLVEEAVFTVYNEDGSEAGQDVTLEGRFFALMQGGERGLSRFAQMYDIRETARTLIDLEMADASMRERDFQRRLLNQRYDAFVKAFGPINHAANVRLFRQDLDWPLLSALEDNYDKGVTPTMSKKTGEPSRKPSADKAALLLGPVLRPYRSPETVDSAEEGLLLALAEHGRVDLDFIAAKWGRPVADVQTALAGKIFRTGAQQWETADAYLSGDVKTKLDEARVLAETDARFAENVEALQEVIPADLEPADIAARMGAPWIPTEYLKAFISHVTGGSRVKLVSVVNMALYEVTVDDANEALNESTWGTKDLSAVDLIAKTLNNRPIRVMRNVETDRGLRQELDLEATTAAQAKATDIEDEFTRWLWDEDTRRDELSRIYNDTMNRTVTRRWDGSHLVLPGKVPDDVITLRPNQKNAAWRYVQSLNGLADHFVGAGKTFTGIAAAMERIRLGISRKALFVVPNHLTGQWAGAVKQLYPTARVLAPTKQDFERSRRRRLFARIATGDWQIVIVGHSSFKKMAVSPEVEKRFLMEEESDLIAGLKALGEQEGSYFSIKKLEKRKASLRARLQALLDAGQQDTFLPFDKMGFDYMAVDESHEFKNLAYTSNLNNVAGLGNTAGSQKAMDLFMKIRYMNDQGQGVLFLTGTPLSNSMSEMYTLMRYLAHDQLSRLMCFSFDNWQKVFAEVTNDWELDSTGVRYSLRSRLSRFVNVPELMTLYWEFADVISREDVNRVLREQGQRELTPPVAGGRPENIVLPRTVEQAAYMSEIVWRAEHWKESPHGPNEPQDNMLRITGDARKAALDMRLVDAEASDDPGSKLNRAVETIFDIYKEWDAQKGVQLVFCDLSTPRGALAKEREALLVLQDKARAGDEDAIEALAKISPDEILSVMGSGFSVYDEAKAKLIAKGMLASQIAFIHDANTELQKEELFSRVRSGSIRVLIGSTPKMGTGANVQDRLVALHHLDCPWRPSDVEQREGRIIRQGNLFYAADPTGFAVRILRWAVERTYDARMWQTIEVKARFIEQLRAGNITDREVDDFASEAANAAELKAEASGNPLILEEVQLRSEIKRLDTLARAHTREQHRIKNTVKEDRAFLATVPTLIANAEKARDSLREMDKEQPVIVAPDRIYDFAVKASKKERAHKTEFIAKVDRVATRLTQGYDQRENLGTLAGIPIALSNGYGRSRLTIAFDLGDGRPVHSEGTYFDGQSAGLRVVNRMIHMLHAICDRADSLRASQARAQKRLNNYAGMVDQPFAQQDELKAKKNRHQAVLLELQQETQSEPEKLAA